MAPYSAEVPRDRYPSLSVSSGASFSSSLDSDFDSNVILHLAPLPVQLPDNRPQSPYDQAIPSILHEVTGAEDLTSVLELKLKVLSNELSLSRLHIYVPQLVVLDLTGSYLQSLRDLGCNLTNLKVLKVDRCCLESLDGVVGLSSVIELSAAYNTIEDLSPAIFLENLKTLNLKGNGISDLGFLELLRDLPLENLTLAENPASRNNSLYFQTVLSTFTQLRFLDGKELPPQPTLPPLTTSNREPDCWATRSGPNASSHAETSELTPTRPQSARPASSGPLARKLPRTLSLTDILMETLEIWESNTTEDPSSVSRLTSGGVVCGNLANALRQRARRSRPDQMPRDEEVMRIVDVDEEFSEPCAVPSSSYQEINQIPSSSSVITSSNSNDSGSSSNSLTDASQRWRQAFSMFREKSLQSWKQHSMELEDVTNDVDTIDEENKEDDTDNTEVSK